MPHEDHWNILIELTTSVMYNVSMHQKRLMMKRKAIQLRHNGLSIKKIAAKLGIAQSTVSIWVRSVRLSTQQLEQLRANSEDGRRLGRKILADRRKRENTQLQHDADATVKKCHAKLDSAFWQIVAALLYWCEGGKRNRSVMQFANSDPQLIKVYLHALRKGFQVDENKLRALIHLHEYHDPIERTEFWSTITGIPKHLFQKPYLKPNSQMRKRENYPGCISIRYYDATVARKLSALYYALGKKFI